MTKPFWILLYLKMEPCRDVDSHHTMALELLLIYLLDCQLILRYYQIIAKCEAKSDSDQEWKENTKCLALEIMREHLVQWMLNVP